MSRLLLIRHAQPEKDATIQASEWRLSHRGRQSCELLAETLNAYGLTRLISSVEPKAVETAQRTARFMGIPSEIALGLHEHDRSNVGFIPDGERFSKIVKQLFDKRDEKVFGAETAHQALVRFSTAVDGLLKQHVDEGLGLVTHGTVMSLFVAAHNSVDGYSFWARLTLPCVVRLDLPSMRLTNENSLIAISPPGHAKLDPMDD